MRWYFPLLAALCLPGAACAAQQPVESPVEHPLQPTQKPIARTSATMLQVAGAVNLDHGEVLLGNGSTVTAESQPVNIALTRGGALKLCSTTSLHLAEDRSIAAPATTALLMALDRGALEAHYSVGKYSDVLLTPDLRILISGPGEAALSIRVNTQGDTCVDNHGSDAPYVTVTSQLDGGLYRVLPNQRVTFEHGSLDEVVDRETEPCGCPAAPPLSVASTGASAGVPAEDPARADQPAGGATPTPADTTFPLAVSEELAPPPAPSSKPAVPAGETHAEVTVPLTYNGEQPPAAPSARGFLESGAAGAAAPSPAGIASPPPGRQKTAPRRFFRRIGHFFSRIFAG